MYAPEQEASMYLPVLLTYQTIILQLLDSVSENWKKTQELDKSQSIYCKKYLEAKVDLETTQDMVDMLEGEIFKLKDTLKFRKKRLKKEQNYIATMASVCFDECLQANDSTGKLEVNFEKSELKLTVAKNGEETSTNGTPHGSVKKLM